MSDTSTTHIVLLHAPHKEDDPYEAACWEVGLAPMSIPVLRFASVNQTKLRDTLAHPDRYAGLVVTSPRAVEALDDALVWLPGQGAAWESSPAFAVGPRTADALRALGFSPTGEQSGDAATLAHRIGQQTFEKPLLFLCGNRRRDVLPTQLAEKGVDLKEVCVYETHLRKDLNVPETADWLVFFSPSGVEAVQHAKLSLDSNPFRAALGPTTANAIRQAGWEVDAVADAPTPEALIEAIRKRETAAS